MNKSTTTSSLIKVVAVVGYLDPDTFMFFKAGQDKLQDL